MLKCNNPIQALALQNAFGAGTSLSMLWDTKDIMEAIRREITWEGGTVDSWVKGELEFQKREYEAEGEQDDAVHAMIASITERLVLLGYELY